MANPEWTEPSDWEDTPEPQLGDRITFRAATRWNDRTATRVVNGFYLGQPTVRYGGSPNFIVRQREILAVADGALAAA